jgi:hypothetical protein
LKVPLAAARGCVDAPDPARSHIPAKYFLKIGEFKRTVAHLCEFRRTISFKLQWL